MADNDNDNPIPLPGVTGVEPDSTSTPPEDEGQFRPETASEAGSKALEEALRVGFIIVRVIIAALIVVFLFSGYYQVESGQQAVVLRFGKAIRSGASKSSPIDLKEAGGHFAWPAGVDEVAKVPMAEIHSARSTVGMYQKSADKTFTGETAEEEVDVMTEFLDPKRDGFLLTRDASIIHVGATLRYKIQKADDYLFRYHNVAMVATNILDNALVHAASQFRAKELVFFNTGEDSVSQGKRQDFRDTVQRLVEQRAADYEMGIQVNDLIIDTIEAPKQVEKAFKEFNKASFRRSEMERLANIDAQNIRTGAEKDAFRIRAEAQVEASRIESSVKADENALEKILPLYQANPGLFMQQQLLQTLQRLMENEQVEIWFVPARNDGTPRQLRLLLNPEPRKAKKKEIKQHQGGLHQESSPGGPPMRP